MRQAVELIVHHAGRYPEFRYYISLMKKAESYLSNQPDICIETCKSLLEGVSKSIIERLDTTAKREELDKKDVGPLIKQAARLLKKADNVIEDDFVTRCSSLAHALGTLRNERGDISHGKAVPKTASSNDRLSALCLSMTENVLSYMLDAFYSIPPEPSEHSQEIDETVEVEPDLPIVSYDDNGDFNDWLDEKYPLPEGRLIYSSALYELYYEDYVIKLEEFREGFGGEE
ncbi:abortive infection family protein [Shinella sedimenti]|uniref:Abortive infection family protein n=1 Tax=Shinella sedimenti TaxID=2919913 RepID=A0ABT0CLL8_9HYPH|nr:abortive infection family protein [Shinella sedimenti]MCJ8149485.1 abortive infection family protein [Shinella sedimenti]